MHGRVLIPVQPGLSIVGGDFYGINSHDVTSPDQSFTTKHAGVLAGLLYRLGEEFRPGIYFFREGGLVREKPRARAHPLSPDAIAGS